MMQESRFDLILINRQLPPDSSEGVALIARIKADPELAATPVMLISNFPESQQAAIAAGAEPGFGKAELDRPETLEKLVKILNM